jgi:hypothetical protein
MYLQKLKIKAEDVVQSKLVNLMSKQKRDSKRQKKAQDYCSYDDYRKFKKNKHNNDRMKKNMEQNMFIDWNLI